MRRTLAALTTTVLIAASVANAGADPVRLAGSATTSGDVNVFVGSIFEWLPPEFMGGGDVIGRTSDGAFVVLTATNLSLGPNAFCRNCEPVRTNIVNAFSVSLPFLPSVSNGVFVTEPNHTAEVFLADSFAITFAGELRTEAALELSDLNSVTPLTLASRVFGIERATGHEAFSFQVSGIGEARIIQTEGVGGELIRGVGYFFPPTPTPEPASLLLLGSGLAFLATRRSRPRENQTIRTPTGG